MNCAISPVVQLLCCGITQFMNPEILSFHWMYDPACSTAVGVYIPKPGPLLLHYPLGARTV